MCTCEFVCGPDGTNKQTKNKYGSAQELRSTFGHLKTFKIIQSFVKGLVGLDLVWSSLV